MFDRFKVNDGLSIENPDYMRSRLCFHALIIASLFLLIFCIFNLVTESYWLAIVDGIALFISIAAIFGHYRRYNINHLTDAAMLAAYVIFIPLVIFNQAQDFMLIWTIFFPVFAIIFKGRQVGLLHTLIFYALVFPVTFMGIDVWQDGTWTTKSFMRFTAASILMTFIIYQFKKIHFQVYEKLLELLQNQKLLSAEMKKLSITDPLTGLHNRRHLQHEFTQELNRARRNNQSICFFIFDLDYFKQYNDTYGHEMGDITLCKIADTFKQHMRRSSDLAFRIGGEEFAGLLATNSGDSMLQLVEELREAVEACAIEHKHNSQGGIVTISVGFHTMHSNEVTEWSDLYRPADMALYQAKSDGRNCCISYLD